MATKPKTRKKVHKPKKVTHSNNLRTTGLFNRRDETSLALGRLETMTAEQRRFLMESLVHEYGKVYFRINVLQGTYEKVGKDIDIFMLMKIYWDIKITIYSLPDGVAKNGMDLNDLDHYELIYKHRTPNVLSTIRKIPVMIATNFIDKGTEPFMIRIDFFPVLPLDKQGEEPVEPFSENDITNIEYWYDALDPANAEFRHRPRTCDMTNGWSQKKYEEHRNAILRKLLPS